jgi:hypothetical protein
MSHDPGLSVQLLLLQQVLLQQAEVVTSMLRVDLYIP